MALSFGTHSCLGNGLCMAVIPPEQYVLDLAVVNIFSASPSYLRL